MPLTPSNLPRFLKNLGGAAGRKAFDFTLQGTIHCVRGMTFAGTTLAAGAAFDPVALGCTEDQLRTLWQQGYIDWD